MKSTSEPDFYGLRQPKSSAVRVDPRPLRAMDPQEAARAAYAQLGFFILDGLPPSSEFGLDTLLWRTERFKVSDRLRVSHVYTAC